MPYPATPRTWVAGDVLTAAQLNAELRDALLGAFPLGPPDAAWTTFVTTWSGTIGNGTLTARYSRIGRMIDFFIAVAWGTTTTHPAAAQTFTLPVAAHAAGYWGIGVATLQDAGVGLYTRTVSQSNSATLLQVHADNVLISNTIPFTWGNLDTLGLRGRYESAT